MKKKKKKGERETDRTFHKCVCPFQEQTGECVVKVELYCVTEVFFSLTIIVIP